MYIFKKIPSPQIPPLGFIAIMPFLELNMSQNKYLFCW